MGSDGFGNLVGVALRTLTTQRSALALPPINHINPQSCKCARYEVFYVEGFVEENARSERSDDGDEGIVNGYLANRIATDEFVVQGETQRRNNDE